MKMIDAATIHSIQVYLKANPWMIGGASLMGLGGIGATFMATLRSIPARIQLFLTRKFTVYVTVNDSANLYRYLKMWFEKNDIQIKKTHILTATCNSKKVIFTPGYGSHHMWYKFRLVQIWRNKEEKKAANVTEAGNYVTGNYIESFTFRFFTTNKKVISEFFDEIHALYEKDEFVPWLKVWTGSWANIMALPNKSYDSVILPNDEKDKIIDNIKNFFDSEDWYNDLSIPYRRGYLLHGLPGTGKTSLIQMIAKSLNKNICFLNLSSIIGDEDLMKAFFSLDSNDILVIEEIDAVFNQRKRVDGKFMGTSFSALLNILDGMIAGHGSITFMTTNHKERLDAALIRPGRIDFQMEFKHADKEQIITLFNRFYNNDEISAEVFYSVLNVPVTMAMLQAHFLKYRDNPKLAIENVDELSKVDETLKVPHFKATKALTANQYGQVDDNDEMCRG